MNNTMGIDISKDTLDAYWLSKCKHRQFANTKMSLSALIRWIRQTKALLIVFEGEAGKELIL
jgi:transposase